MLLQELREHGGLSGARGSWHEHEQPLAGAHVVEGACQRGQLGVASLDVSTDDELTGNVILPQDQGREGLRSPEALTERGQVAQQPVITLVALVRILREQLGHELCEDRRYVGRQLGDERSALGHVRVSPADGVGRRERQLARQHLEERDAQRIVVCSVIGATVEAARPLWRDVGE
ncbi:hypothetical protein WME82_35820 [Sorangium sp. So ce128]